MSMTRWVRNIATVLLLAVAAGCASTGGGDARDPFEGFNRAMHSFNDGFDQAVGKPVATAYRNTVPDPIRTWVRNFFANIGDLFIGANNLLQGKPGDAVTDWARFAFNTTIGLLGINDVATEMGLEKHDEDFGQTFGRWGAGDGAYVVWPLIGSSSVRDSVGLVLDFHFDPLLSHKPVATRNLFTVTRATSKRADLLDASRILEEAALDKYVFQRDAYLQRRRSLVHDGNAPRAARETPRAEMNEEAPRTEATLPQAQPVAAPAAVQPRSASPAAFEAAVQLLEAPAALPPHVGG
jgi:phospholipid-binding lipoprotein MlaA